MSWQSPKPLPLDRDAYDAELATSVAESRKRRHDRTLAALERLCRAVQETASPVPAAVLDEAVDDLGRNGRSLENAR